MSTDFDQYFQHYLKLVQAGPLLPVLQETHEEFMAQLAGVDDDRGRYRYAPDKWSIKEVVAHVIDTERIFAYRALRFARQDTTALPGYDENHFVEYSGADNRSIAGLKEEFDLVRKASIALYKSFDDRMLARQGTANNMTIGVKPLLYLMAGHGRHHGNILRERYGVQ